MWEKKEENVVMKKGNKLQCYIFTVCIFYVKIKKNLCSKFYNLFKQNNTQYCCEVTKLKFSTVAMCPQSFIMHFITWISLTHLNAKLLKNSTHLFSSHIMHKPPNGCTQLTAIFSHKSINYLNYDVNIITSDFRTG